MQAPGQRQTLSRASEALEAELAARPVAEGRERGFDCDVVVVGSGYGGAVAAARLAGAQEADGRPCRVWVLERGREHHPGDFPSRWAELPGELRLSMQDGKPPVAGRDEGLYDLRVGSEAMALLGNGLGGGSLINAGVMLRPEPDVFKTGWPTDLSLEALKCAYDQAEKMLGVQVPKSPERDDRVGHLLTGKFTLLKQLAERAHPPQTAEPSAVTINVTDTKQHSAAGVPMPACTRCGDCLTGCNVGAKGSLDTNYLAWARQRGVELWTGVTVERLEADAEGGWRLHWGHTQPELRACQQVRVLRARRVVLSAGALGSTEILLRSRGHLALPRNEPKLGKRFSLNGDTLIATVGHAQRVGIVADPESDPAQPGREVGPTISGQVHVPASDVKPGFLLQEFAVPAALKNLFAEITAQRLLFEVDEPNKYAVTGAGDCCEEGAASSWALRLGVPDPVAVHEHALDRSALFGVMGRDSATGSLDLVKGHVSSPPDGSVRVQWSREGGTKRISDAATRWLNAVGREATPLPWNNLLFSEAPSVTVHPLGGCAMADSPREGVVNSIGQVFSDDDGAVHKGLVVLDGSIVPTALGVNPAFTIAALAERALPLLCQAWGLREAAPFQPATTPAEGPPSPSKLRHELGPSHSSWHLRERLQGRCSLDTHDLWARLDIEFETVPGWRRALQAQPRVLNIAHAKLRLYEVKKHFDFFDLDEQNLPPLKAHAHLSGSMRVAYVEPSGSVKPHKPRPEPEPEPELVLCYRLAVTAVGGAGLPGLRVGGRLEGTKRFRDTPNVATASHRDRPLRALSEMDVRLDGHDLGRWALDFGDLADRAQALMALADASNQPDALDDVLSLVLYGQRWAARYMLEGLLSAGEKPAPELVQRLKGQQQARSPGACITGGALPKVFSSKSGGAWVLHRYPALGAAGIESLGTPVLLIHGLGVSGSMFTHPSLGVNLAAWLGQQQGERAARDVWVLDLSSSIANDEWRQSEEAESATVQTVGRRDITEAVLLVCGETGAKQLDVVAHCMGGIMLVLTALADGAPLEGRIRRAVISQTGPLVRLSPLNRFRAFLAGRLRALLEVGELDATPELNLGGDWPLAARVFDAVAALFPYPDDDGFIPLCSPPNAGTNSQSSSQQAECVDMERIRRRADTIFGQLFEAKQMAPEALRELGALFGWVKLRMLSEALNLARDDMVTEADGRNQVLSAARLQTQFNFPVLFLHGRRNRVFDWRGGLRSLHLLAQVRGHAVTGPHLDDAHGAQCYRAGDVQLVVFDDHGHLDTLMGQASHQRVFPMIDEFLALNLSAPTLQGSAAPYLAPLHTMEAPWLGPMLGWLRRVGQGAGGWLTLDLVVHPSQRRVKTHGVVLLPVRDTAQGHSFLWDQARWFYWDQQQPRGRVWPQQVQPGDARAMALTLQLHGTRFSRAADAIMVLMQHTAGGQRPTATDAERPPDRAVRGGWMRGGDHLWPETLRQLQAWVQNPQHRAELQASRFVLPPAVQAAADQGSAAADKRVQLRLALASCQYPPGPLDREPAERSLRRLLADALGPDGPQLLLLAGDQVYLDADAGVFQSRDQGDDEPARLARHDLAYENVWGLPAFRALAARLPILPMLDDHEVRDNWQGHADPGVAAAQVDIALSAFDRFQGLLMPTRRVFSGAGDASSTRSWVSYPAGVPLLALDTRTRRTLRDAKNRDSAHILPEEELRAVIQQLKRLPKDAVKLVLLPVPLLPPEKLGQVSAAASLRSDTWSGYPASAVELLAALRDGGIRRVVLLSGDSHQSSVSTLRLEGGEHGPVEVVSVVSSGLYAPWPFANQRPGALVLEGRVSWHAGQRKVDGEIKTLASSSANGYAWLSLDQQGASSAVLHVRLQPDSGAAIEVRLGL